MKTERQAKPKKAVKKAPAKPARKDARKDVQRVFEGLGVSPGVGIGKVHLRESGEVQVVEYKVPARRLPDEIKRFHGALAQSRRQVGKLAGAFEAEVTVVKNGTEVPGSSILGLMMLAAAPGCELELRARGPAAQAAIGALRDLVEKKFDED